MKIIRLIVGTLGIVLMCLFAMPAIAQSELEIHTDFPVDEVVSDEIIKLYQEQQGQMFNSWFIPGFEYDSLGSNESIEFKNVSLWKVDLSLCPETEKLDQSCLYRAGKFNLLVTRVEDTVIIDFPVDDSADTTTNEPTLSNEAPQDGG